MLFAFKKVLGPLMMPLPLGIFVIALAYLCYRRGFVKLAKAALIGVLVTWYLLSISPVAKFIAGPLEFQYPKYDDRPVAYVVVLGGGHHSDDRVPISSLLSQSSLTRLSEGIRIYRQNPGAKLLLSGYNGQGQDLISNAEAMSSVAQAYFVPEQDIIIEPSPRDTGEEARAWANKVNGEAFALVTSALHMPRAMYLFKQAGLDPIPAPTEYQSHGRGNWSWKSWVPKGSALYLVERAWHEYLGLAWARLRS